MSNIADMSKDMQKVPPLTSEQMSFSKLRHLKYALLVFYCGLPVSLVSLLSMFILDENSPIAESLWVAFPIVGLFFVIMLSVIFIIKSPIYKRLMRVVDDLDEGEVYLQRMAYSFAYRVMFRMVLFVVPIVVVVNTVTNSSVFGLDMPQVDGGSILISAILTFIFTILGVILLPMVYFARNLKPVNEED